MKISNSPQIFNRKISPDEKKSARTQKNPAFSSILRINPEVPWKRNDSFFYRGINTLFRLKELQLMNAKKGSTNLFAGCSVGEGLASYRSLFRNPNQYKNIGIDSEESIIEIAKKEVFSIFSNWHDSFLLKSDEELLQLDKAKPEGNLFELKSYFTKMFEPTSRPEYQINFDPIIQLDQNKTNFLEHFFTLKPEYKGQVDFFHRDIRNFSDITPEEKFNTILFRNSFYHPLENHIDDVMRQHNFGITPNINRGLIATEIIDSIRQGTQRKGFFVLGNIPKEHLIQADDFTPDSNKIYLPDTKGYKQIFAQFKAKYKNDANYQDKLNRVLHTASVPFCKISPIETALKKNGYKPVFYDSMTLEVPFFRFETSVATIWQKK